MRFLLYSDLQLHPWKEFSRIDENGVNDRLVDHIKVLDQILDYAKNNDIDYILFGGDMFEARGKVDIVAAKLLAAWKHKVSNSIRQIDLVGNHDLVDKSTTNNAIELYSHIANQTIIAKPEWKMWNEEGYKQAILFVPFMYRLEDVKAGINLEPPLPVDKEHAIAIVHYGLYDVLTETHGIIHDEGHETEGQLRLSDLEVLLQRVKYVFFGHYHITTAVTPQVHFIGTPIQHKFGEKTVQTRFLDVDLLTGTFQSIPTQAPRFLDVGWLDIEKVDVAGNFVRTKAPSAEQQQKAKEALLKAGARGVDVQIAQAPKFYKSTLGLDLNMSFEEMGAKMVDDDGTTLDKGRLKQIMLECLQQAAQKKSI